MTEKERAKQAEASYSLHAAGRLCDRSPGKFSDFSEELTDMIPVVEA